MASRGKRTDAGAASAFNFDMAVIDELSSFKNHQSKRFKAFMKDRQKLKRIVGLTGTPASNGLMDLFAEFKLLDTGERLGRFIAQRSVSKNISGRTLFYLIPCFLNSNRKILSCGQINSETSLKTSDILNRHVP